MSLSILAQVAPLQQGMPDPRLSWAPVLVLLVIAIAFAVGTLLISVVVGPSRTGKGKETTYESGMLPVGDARRRFNVAFYLVAITFVVFDVEIIFFYPWATAFPHMVSQGHPASGLMLVAVLVFIALILIGYLYEWGKGVFRWD